MEKEKFMQEGVDIKRLFLLLVRKIWLVVLAIILGTIIGALLYNVVTSYTNGEEKYRVSNDYYITFNFEQFENSTDYYNAYTWDSILRDDPIVDYAMTELSDSVKKEDILAAVSGEMLGDYRILTVHVTTTDPALSQNIANAYVASLTHFATEVDMLKKISLWSSGTPQIINENTRTKNAAFLGGLIACLLSLIILFITYLLDDAVYVETDFTKRFNIPFLGTITNKKEERRIQELCDNYNYLCRDERGYYLVNVATSETIENACVPLLAEKCAGIKKQMLLKENGFEEIRNSGGAILMIPYGQTNGKILIKIINLLQKQDCKIAGAVLTDADDRFLKNYYLGRRNS